MYCVATYSSKITRAVHQTTSSGSCCLAPIECRGNPEPYAQHAAVDNQPF